MVAFAPPPVRPPSEYDNDDSATRAISYPGTDRLVFSWDGSTWAYAKAGV